MSARGKGKKKKKKRVAEAEGGNSDGEQVAAKKRAKLEVDVPTVVPKIGATPKVPQTLAELHKGKRLIIFLDEAKLETVKTSRGYELLNCDDHRNFHKKHRRDAADSRPDICHQSLLALLDSPLNKAGLLKVYVRTSKNVLIDINPTVRIPRTIKRFNGLMVQLLHKLKIRAVDGPVPLLKVIKNPINQYLPPGSPKYVTSCNGRLVNPHRLVKSFPDDRPVVIAFGSMAHGTIEHKIDWADDCLSFSQYPLSAACAIGRLLNAVENHWGVL
eukprot:g4538.t1